MYTCTLTVRHFDFQPYIQLYICIKILDFDKSFCRNFSFKFLPFRFTLFSVTMLLEHDDVLFRGLLTLKTLEIVRTESEIEAFRFEIPMVNSLEKMI